MLRVENLHVLYGRVVAVQGVSLTVEEGEAVAVVGANGAGKSSTLAAISGLVRPADGEITFRGRSILNQPPEATVRDGISLVPEGRHIFATLTVEENLRVGASARRNGETETEITRLYERFPALANYARAPAGRLSGGEQQQLAIARALLSQPRLLMLDEPSLGLAPMMVDTVFNELAELRAQGVTILLVEQNARRALEFADRAYALRGGRVGLQGPSGELLRNRDVEQLYLGVS